MLDNVMVPKSQQANSIVIGLSMLENLANESSVPNDGSLTVPWRWREAWFVIFSPSWCVVQFQILFFENKLAEMSLATTDCVCHCLGVATLSYESIVQKQQEITVCPRPLQTAPNSPQLRTQYASCVCMLSCHYTHPLLANMQWQL